MFAAIRYGSRMGTELRRDGCPVNHLITRKSGTLLGFEPEASRHCIIDTQDPVFFVEWQSLLTSCRLFSKNDCCFCYLKANKGNYIQLLMASESCAKVEGYNSKETVKIVISSPG